jgi:purine-binding chemotaxis protein CheW
MNNILKIDNFTTQNSLQETTLEQFLSVKVCDQLFGIPVIKIVDVLKPQQITKIPLAKYEVVGLMNLRGRIVTVIDLRRRLGLNSEELPKKQMFVVVECGSELFSLIVDEVGEAQNLNLLAFEKNPENLSQNLRLISRGIFKFDKELMLVIDVNALVNF